MDFARVTNNSSLCDTLTKNDTRHFCYAELTIDEGECNKIINRDKKDNCYYIVAINTKDDNLCARITIDFLKVKCYEYVAS